MLSSSDQIPLYVRWTPEHSPYAVEMRLDLVALVTNELAQAQRLGIEIGGNDKAAIDVAKQLVSDAGFEPVMVGDLAKTKLFDPGTPVYPKTMTAKEIRAALML